MKRITVLVSNDLTHDQRVKKTCASLMDQGHEPFLIGRKLKSSMNLERPYPTRRLSLGFSKGVLFYAALNIRLFFFLLFHKTDTIWANDLDTLLPAFLASKLRGKELIYDSHEYFTEAAGLSGRAFQKGVWQAVEGLIFPRLKNVITVNESIAKIYREKYGVDVKVLRNVPVKREKKGRKGRKEMGLPEDRFIAILQGAYLDIDRGALEAVKAVEQLEGVLLLLIGSGADHKAASEYVKANNLEDKVMVFPKLPYEELCNYTACSDIGLSLDKGLYFNYLYSLPNKVFDYIHAGIPVLASNLPEVSNVVLGSGIGICIEEVNPEQIARGIELMRSCDLSIYHPALEKAKEDFHWEREFNGIM